VHPVLLFNSIVFSFPWTDRCAQMKEMAQYSLAVHLWDTKRGRSNRDIENSSFLSKITSLSCPLSHKLISQHQARRSPRQHVAAAGRRDEERIVVLREQVIKSIAASRAAGASNLSSSIPQLSRLAQELNDVADVQKSPSTFSQLYRESVLLSNIVLQLQPDHVLARNISDRSGNSLLVRWRKSYKKHRIPVGPLKRPPSTPKKPL